MRGRAPGSSLDAFPTTSGAAQVIRVGDGWGWSRVTYSGCRARRMRAASSVVEHLTFNQGVLGSIPRRPTSLVRPGFNPEFPSTSRPRVDFAAQ